MKGLIIKLPSHYIDIDGATCIAKLESVSIKSTSKGHNFVCVEWIEETYLDEEIISLNTNFVDYFLSVDNQSWYSGKVSDNHAYPNPQIHSFHEAENLDNFLAQFKETPNLIKGYKFDKAYTLPEHNVFLEEFIVSAVKEYKRLLSIQKAKGYKMGWCYHKTLDFFIDKIRSHDVFFAYKIKGNLRGIYSQLQREAYRSA